MFQPMLGAAGTKRWADVSIDTAAGIDVFARAVPDAKFVCLYRDGKDVIASTLEAYPWGLNHPRLATVAARHPTNSVAAVASYWASSTTAILDFERANSQRCYRVHYEELVTRPDAIVSDLFEWLELAPAPDLVERFLTLDHDPRLGADHKVWATTRIHAESIGSGRRVPSWRVPPTLRRDVSALLDELGYGEIDGSSVSRSAAAGHVAATPAARHALAVLDDTLEETLRRNIARLHPISSRWASVIKGREIKLSVDDGDLEHSLHWVVGIDSQQIVRRPVPTESTDTWTIVAEAGALLAVLQGELNLAIALRDGRICVTGVSGSERGAARLRLQVMARLFAPGGEGVD